MVSLLRKIIRPSAFLRAEILEILRQPQLVLILILGPFLILFLFGIGYHNQARALRTIFVVQPESPLGSEIQRNASTLGPQLIYAGVTSDETQAKEMLRRGEVDVVAVAPPNSSELIRNNQEADFVLYHNEIDPLQVEYVKYFGQVYVDEVNRRVLMGIVQQGQGETANIQDALKRAHDSAAAMRTALERGDAATARNQQRELNAQLSALEVAAAASVAVLGSVESEVGSAGQSDLPAIQQTLTTVQQNEEFVGTIPDNQGSYTDQAQRAARLEKDLGDLQTRLANFRNIDPLVLVSPFRAEAQSVAAVQPTLTSFFAPSVIVVLLQHLAVTLGALSLVRERQLGTLELFRVSPLSSGETLVGKYLSYLLFGGLVACILTLGLIYGLQVPMLGNWFNYAFAIGLLLFAALGYGFVISLVSDTDTQAVQYAMILLLATVFFSGFILRLQNLTETVRLLSWALPATYSIDLLQNIMLRGNLPAIPMLGALAGMGMGLYLVALVLLRRQMGHA